MTDPVVADQITYLYPNGRGVKDFSFHAGEGELLCISGSNGSGKTTLFRVLSTLYRPQNGTVLIGGHDAVLRKDLARGSLFPVFDESAHIGYATGWENLEFIQDLYRSDTRDRVEHYARHFALDLGLPVDEFSRGMKRKLLLMEALLSGKGILLFDEPTLGLDSGTRSVFFQFLRELSESGSTIIFGTNRNDEAVHAGRTLFIESGTLSPTPPEIDPEGMIELRVIMDTDEYSEFVLHAEEIPGVISRILPIGIPPDNDSLDIGVAGSARQGRPGTTADTTHGCAGR